MKTPNPSDLLAQIAQIQLMERGKLSSYAFAERGPQAPRYYKLQSWERGKNVTRYIHPDQVPLLQEALSNHAKFQELTAQYAQLIIDQTREELAALGSKKKRRNRRPTSSWPRSRRSSS
jgi:hypothetical protein